MRRTVWLSVAVVVVAGACVPVGPGGGTTTDGLRQLALRPRRRTGARRASARARPRLVQGRQPARSAVRAVLVAAQPLRAEGTRARPRVRRDQGRDDVVIAVLDSGIKWRDAGAMSDLARQAYINIGEARPPCARRQRRLQRRRPVRHHRLRRAPRPQRQRRRRPGGSDPRPRVQQRRRRRPQRLRRRHLGLGLPLRRQQPARHRRATATAPARPRTRPRPRTAPATSARARSCRFAARPRRRLVHRRRRPLRGRRAVRARLGRRRDPGGARRDQQSAAGAAGDRRRVPARTSWSSRRWPTRRRSTRTCRARSSTRWPSTR